MSNQPLSAGAWSPDGSRRATRAAVLTPLGQGGIGVIHVVGPGAIELTAQCFRPRNGGPPGADSRRLHYGHIVDEGEIVDEALVRLVPPAQAPDDVPRAEVNCHGGVVAVQRVLECLLRQGAEAVEAEDLLASRATSRLEAEAAEAVVQAATALGVEVLLAQLDGVLERALTELPWDWPQDATAAIGDLLATERLGRALWQPPRVALVGPANAGKSTLFNALAREDRVLVSPRPGTTRDAVAAEVALGGIPLWLTDTAGHRPPGSALEEQAIARGRVSAAEARLVLLVLDGSQALARP
ncbi:MAG: GTPase, partial [Planctomycetota bacterium]